MPRLALFGTCLLLLVGLVFAFVRWNSPTLLETAETSLAIGDNEAAIHALRTYLVRNPGANDVRMKLASLTAASNPPEALDQWRLIPAENAHHVDALRQIALLCLQTGRDDEAENALLALEVAAPDDFAVQLSLAEHYFHQENYKDALPRAMHAATLQPDRANTFLLIAEIRDGLRQKPEMIAPLMKAIELAPDSYEAHLNLAYASHASGQLTQAANAARWCLERNTNEVFAYRILASVARDEGRFDEADTELNKALTLAPRDVDCRILEADLLLYDRKPDEAYQRLKELHEEHRETYRFLGALARAAAASGRIEEARQLHRDLDELRSTENKMNPEVTPGRLLPE